ncbi:alpha/beta fold hydrolase [Rubrobacter marinus]|uniref:Alpha/beta fold hydrolase n=1 Tax=Rubrobacter marinus TaxID=2653852 RepID=A0A6G8PT82_9ACTN|nr:alpha/beta fold hydrolase [Rubrobacter marinus]
MAPALVLIPGLLCDERLWHHQSEGLAALADPILVPGVTGHDSVRGMAGAVLEEVPERFALAGLSMGGYVALEVVRQAPERVVGLALLDTSARPDTPSRRRPASRSSRWRGTGASTRCGAPFCRGSSTPSASATRRSSRPSRGWPSPWARRRSRGRSARSSDARTAAASSRASPAPPSSCAGGTTPSRPLPCTRSSPRGYRGTSSLHRPLRASLDAGAS